jgi:hypothetical protein
MNAICAVEVGVSKAENSLRGHITWFSLGAWEVKISTISSKGYINQEDQEECPDFPRERRQTHSLQKRS